MSRNHKFFFDSDGTPRARGPSAERVLMTFLEVDVQGSDHICHDLMDDLVAIGDGSDDLREFVGNAHRVTISPDGVLIEALEGGESAPVQTAAASPRASVTAAIAGANGGAGRSSYRTGLKHFREVLEDWEAFILDDELEDDSLRDDDFN